MPKVFDGWLDIGANRRSSQGMEIVSKVCCQQTFDRRSNQINNRMQIARLILDRPQQLLHRCLDRATLRVSQYNHQACSEVLRSELDASDEGGRDDIAGHAYHEQVSQTLIEHDFDGDPG